MNFVSSITLAFKDAFSSGFNEAKDSLAGMRGALDEMNQNQSLNRLAADMAMMTSMTEPMRKALSDAMDQPSRIAGSLDTSFRQIQIAAGATSEEMAVMRRELLAIGGRAVAGPEAVADAFSDVASGIADASKHMAVMNAAVLLSEANNADLAMSTNALVNVMNAWDLSAEQAAIATDILTQTSIMGVGSIDEFTSSISSISALAASAGIGLDELGASFAYVTNKGLSAGQVQKQLKGIMSTLVSPSESLAKVYESLGIESGQAMIQQYGLTESLSILKDALGDDAFATMIGSAEAATVALALTEDAYVNFAASFGEGMKGISEAARGVQLESIEAKMARLDAASESLQAQIGQDINGIKGFFIDMKFGFLSNVVSPIMSSPVGGAVSKIAAVTGMAAKSVLDLGSTALNTAAQMTTLAANISNAGGIAKMFQSSVGLIGGSLKMLSAPLRVVGSGILGMGKSIIGALPSIGGYIASMWASVAATIAATWPILAIIAGVAALAAGVYLLIKNWDKVADFFKNLWEGIKGVFSGIGSWFRDKFGAAKEAATSGWEKVTTFFGNVGGKIQGAFSKMGGWFAEKFNAAKEAATKAWNNMPGFFQNVWGNIKGKFQEGVGFIDNIVSGLPEPFQNVYNGIKNIISNVVNFLKNTFSSGIDAVKNIVAVLPNLFSDPIGTIKTIIGEITGFFKNVFGDAVNAIKTRFSGIGSWFGEKFTAAREAATSGWDNVSGFFQNVWRNIKESFSNLGSWFSSKSKAVFEGFRNIVDNVILAVTGFFQKGGDFINNIIGGLPEPFQNLFNGIRNVVGGFIGFFKNIFSSGITAVKNIVSVLPNIFSDPIGTVKAIIGEVVTFLKNVFQGGIDFIKGIFGNFPEFFSNIWNNISAGTKSLWNGITDFFTGILEKIKNVFSVVKQFFVDLWNDPKATIMAFIDWVGSKVEAFTAPFKAVGNVVSGVFDSVGGFFSGIGNGIKDFFGGAKDSGAALNDAFASGINSNASAPGAAFGQSIQTVSRQMPHSDAPEGPLSTLTASGRALTETFASGMDESDLREKASLVFSAAAPQGETFEFPPAGGSTVSGGSQTIHIQNLYLQAEECETLLDFVRMIIHSVNRPEETPA